MRFNLIALVLIASSAPAMADHLPPQGNFTVVEGLAHIERGPLGTYIHIERPGTDVVGYVPFGDDGAFPGLFKLDGRKVAIQGVVVMDGRAMIVMTDPDQLSIG
jgi:hypothetical protein